MPRTSPHSAPSRTTSNGRHDVRVSHVQLIARNARARGDRKATGRLLITAGPTESTALLGFALAPSCAAFALGCAGLPTCCGFSQAEGHEFETRVPLSEITADFSEASSDRGPAWTRLLGAVDRGDSVAVRELAVQLAHEVLSSAGVALAHQVLAGGPHATAKAIQLAEHLLNSASPPLPCLPAASPGDGEAR